MAAIGPIHPLEWGDYRTSLEALRDVLADRLMVAADDPRRLIHVAPISKQLSDVLARIESLPNAERASVSDDLRARRASRRAVSEGQ